MENTKVKKMIERFGLIVDGNVKLKDNETSKEYVTSDEVIMLLNKFNNKIIELKSEDKRLNDVIINLHDEIKNLTKDNKKYLEIIYWQKELLNVFFEDLEM